MLAKLISYKHEVLIRIFDTEDIGLSQVEHESENTHDYLVTLKQKHINDSYRKQKRSFWGKNWYDIVRH